MRIKIFSDEIEYKDGGVLRYCHDVDRYVQAPSSRIETLVNEFCAEHNVISITPSVATVANNPPTGIITYTVVYDDPEDGDKAKPKAKKAK